MKPRDVGNNVARLLGATGGWVHLETKMGVSRDGRLSGWTCRTLKLNGVDIQLPYALELNGDPSDTVKLEDISKMEIQDKKTTS